MSSRTRRQNRRLPEASLDPWLGVHRTGTEKDLGFLAPFGMTQVRMLRDDDRFDLYQPMARVTKGSGNVFRDLDLHDADLLQAKADLVHRISVLIGKRGMTQIQAAEVLGITQPKISALLHGRLDGFSMDRIVRFLNSLDQDVNISVQPKVKARPMVKVA